MGMMKNMADNDRQSSRRARVQVLSELTKREQAWTTNIIKYLQERIDKLRVSDTQTLRSSIVGMLHNGPNTTIEHSFLLYGKYICDGVAREFGDGYTDSMGRTYDFHRGGEGTWNAGQLPFLDQGYRREHGLDSPKRVGPAWRGRVAGGHPREGKDWFFKKYYASRMWLNEMELAAYGEAYQGMLTMVCEEMLKPLRKA